MEKAKTIKFIYGIIFGVLSIVVAGLLILQVCDIYFNATSNSPYTQEAISTHFAQISIPFFLWLAMIVGGFVLWEIFPDGKQKNRGNDPLYAFEKTKGKLRAFEPSEEGKQALAQAEKYERFKKTVRIACAVCCAVCLLFCLAYLLNTDNFPNVNQNAEVAKGALYLLPFVLGAFALCIGVYFFEKTLVNRQLPLMKSAIATGKKVAPVEEEKNALTRFLEKDSTLLVARIVVAVVGVTLLVIGLCGEGYAGVLAKAIAICKQCIGLG